MQASRSQTVLAIFATAVLLAGGSSSVSKSLIEKQRLLFSGDTSLTAYSGSLPAVAVTPNSAPTSEAQGYADTAAGAAAVADLMAKAAADAAARAALRKAEADKAAAEAAANPAVAEKQAQAAAGAAAAGHAPPDAARAAPARRPTGTCSSTA